MKSFWRILDGILWISGLGAAYDSFCCCSSSSSSSSGSSEPSEPSGSSEPSEPSGSSSEPSEPSGSSSAPSEPSGSSEPSEPSGSSSAPSEPSGSSSEPSGSSSAPSGSGSEPFESGWYCIHYWEGESCEDLSISGSVCSYFATQAQYDAQLFGECVPTGTMPAYSLATSDGVPHATQEECLAVCE